MKKLGLYKFIIAVIAVLLLLFWDILSDTSFDNRRGASAQVKQTVTILPSPEPEPEPAEPTFGDPFFFIIPFPIVEEEVGGPPPEEEIAPEEEIIPEKEIVPEERMPPEEAPLIEEELEEIFLEEIPEVFKIPFEVELIIKDKNKKIFPGKDLVAQGEIIKFEPKERINIPLHYQIKDENNEIILDYTETIFIKAKFSFLKTFHITEEARVGKYTIFLEVPYGDIFASSSDTFEILEESVFAAPAEIVITARRVFKEFGLIFIIFLTISIILIWVLWKISAIIKRK